MKGGINSHRKPSDTVSFGVIFQVSSAYKDTSLALEIGDGVLISHRGIEHVAQQKLGKGVATGVRQALRGVGLEGILAAQKLIS